MDRRLAVDLPPDLPLIYVDPVLVQQALIQIFDNGVKYSAPASQIAVRAHTTDGHMFISVTDQGAGLTRQKRQKSGTASRAASVMPQPPAVRASACGSPMRSSPRMAEK